jgi:hypothetical protein
MKKILCISCFILMTTFGFAQDTTMAVSDNKYFHIDFGVGYMKADLRSVNHSITALGYKPLQEDFVSASISSAFVIKRWMVRNELRLLMDNSTRQGENLTSYFGVRSVGFGIGYVLIARPGFRLYPFVNLNSYTGRLRFEDNSPVGNMDGLLNTPHYSSKLHFSNASLDVGLQAEKLISVKQRKWDCPQNGKFMTLGLRVGYSFGGSGVKGRYNGINQPIADAPSFANNGPYMKLVMGFGTKMRDLKWKK